MVEVNCDRSFPPDAHPKEWLPPFFQMKTMGDGFVSGVVNSKDELQQLLKCHSRVTLTSYAKWADDKNSKRKKAARNRILWKIEDIDDNIPLQVTSREILNCQYGKPPKPTKNPTVKTHRPKRGYISKQQAVVTNPVRQTNSYKNSNNLRRPTSKGFTGSNVTMCVGKCWNTMISKALSTQTGLMTR
ncbi:uncharacterized protein [Apostichopus japonicus]|uniref:uncharacterized protein isoform X3 n=1 Tax=Stichopus japonicus TaxID=307972 RepID=UPI003AB1A477